MLNAERAPLRLSFSSMSDYDMCPHRYYLKEVEGFPRARASPIMIYGTVMHAGVQEYWERRMQTQKSLNSGGGSGDDHEFNHDNGDLPQPSDLVNYVRGLWFEDASPLFHEQESSGAAASGPESVRKGDGGDTDWAGGTVHLATFSPPSAHAVLGKQAEDGIRAFVEWANADAVAGGVTASPPSAVELKLDMDLGRWASRTGYARARELEGVTLVGVVDAAWGLAEDDAEGGFAIAEYKSNAFGAGGRQKIKQMARSSLQPRLYAMLIREELRRRRQREEEEEEEEEEEGGCGSARPVVMVQGIEQRAAMGEAPLGEGAMGEAVEAVADTARGIRNGEFAAKPGRFACGWCGWRSVCRHVVH